MLSRQLQEHHMLEGLVCDDCIFRKREYIRDEPLKSISSLRGLVFNILHRITRLHYFNLKKDTALSRKALRVAYHHNAGLFLYSYYAYEAFSDLKFKKPKILFQLHPHPKLIQDIFNEEILLNPASSGSLSLELEMQLDEEGLNRLYMEAYLADYIVCASGFTRLSLIAAGIPSAKIHVIPYGIHPQHRIEPKKDIKQRLEILFVGSITQRKGVSYLLEAIRKIQDKINIRLTIVSRGIFSDESFSEHGIHQLRLLRDISDKFLEDIYQNSHLLILPSIAEGFGQVILEAMSFGTPVITTVNTAGPDIIDHEIDGFIVPVRDAHNISKYISELYQNPERYHNMCLQALKKSRLYSWTLFGNKIKKFLETNVFSS